MSAESFGSVYSVVAGSLVDRAECDKEIGAVGSSNGPLSGTAGPFLRTTGNGKLVEVRVLFVLAGPVGRVREIQGLAVDARILAVADHVIVYIIDATVSAAQIIGHDERKCDWGLTEC